MPRTIVSPVALAASLALLALFSDRAHAQQSTRDAADCVVVGNVEHRLFTQPTGYAAALARAAENSSPNPGGSSQAMLASLAHTPLAVGVEGDAPVEAAITSDGATVLVVCRDSDSVEFFDAHTGVRLGRTLVDDEPIHVALTPDGTRALVTCIGAQTLCIVDVASRTLTRSVPNVGTEPYRALSTSDGARAIVGSVGRLFDLRGEFVVVDVASGTILSHITTPWQFPVGAYISDAAVGVYMEDFELTPDDARIVLANYTTMRMLVYDIASGVELANIPTGPYTPVHVALDSAGTRAVTSLINGGSSMGAALHVLDLQSLTSVTLPLPAPAALGDLVLSGDGRNALVGTLQALYDVDVTTGIANAVAPGAYWEMRATLAAGGQDAIVSMSETSLVSLASGTVLATDPAFLLHALAASPAERRFVGVSVHLDETLRCFSFTNTAITREWASLPGDAVELDGPLDLALTRDGLHAAVSCMLSNNIAFVDLEHQSVVSVTATGGMPLDVALGDDDEVALVPVYDPPSVAVVDLAAGQIATSVPMPGAARRVATSADGRRACVTSGAPTRLTFLDVNGAATHAVGDLLLPEILFDIRYSPAADLVATLAPSPSVVRLVDVPSRTIVATLPVSEAPLDGEFSADGSRLVTSAFGGFSFSLIHVAGAASTVTTIPSSQQLLAFALDAAGQYAYFVANAPQSNPFGFTFVVRVVDLSNGQLVASVPLPLSFTSSGGRYYPVLAKRLGDRLLVSESEHTQRIWRVRMAGAASSCEETIPGASYITYGAVSASLGRLVLPSPLMIDELVLARFGGDATIYCDPATPNSTGSPARISAHGTFLAGAQPLQIGCDRLPAHKLALLLVGDAAASVPAPFGLGTLCVGGHVARFGQEAQSSSGAGVVAFDVDIGHLPFSPPVAITPGETWYFQVWYRDSNGGPTTNLSSAVAIQYD